MSIYKEKSDNGAEFTGSGVSGESFGDAVALFFCRILVFCRKKWYDKSYQLYIQIKI